MKLTDEVTPEIEQMARELILLGKGDPDQLVQPGQPSVYGTPNGAAFAVIPEAAIPLWRLYIQPARKSLDIARALLTPKPKTEAEYATERRAAAAEARGEAA